MVVLAMVGDPSRHRPSYSPPTEIVSSAFTGRVVLTTVREQAMEADRPPESGEDVGDAEVTRSLHPWSPCQERHARRCDREQWDTVRTRGGGGSRVSWRRADETRADGSAWRGRWRHGGSSLAAAARRVRVSGEIPGRVGAGRAKPVLFDGHALARPNALRDELRRALPERPFGGGDVLRFWDGTELEPSDGAAPVTFSVSGPPGPRHLLRAPGTRHRPRVRQRPARSRRPRRGARAP